MLRSPLPRGWHTGAVTVLTLAISGSAAARLDGPAGVAERQAAPVQVSTPNPTAAERPRVRLLATGGTISNRTGSRLSADELLASIPQASTWARAEAEQFANVASSQLTLDDFLKLARRINTLFQTERDLAGVVVTCGTDTLEELAYFLQLTVRDDRPVVVVGSMRNPSTIGYEGAANLLEGFRVAAEPAARGLGTLVVMNDEINAARDVTKTDALRLHTFQSRTVGVLGVVDTDKVAFYRKPVRRAGARVEFDVNAIDKLPRVDVVMVYQDAPGDLIKAAVDAGAKGLVLATAGAGATSGTQSEGLNYAADRGVFIVRGTRTGSGRIAPGGGGFGQNTPEARRRRAFFIAADDLAPVKARMLLMLGLTRTSSQEELQRLFLEY